MTAQNRPPILLEKDLHLARNAAVKGLLLFVIFNLVFAIWYPLAGLGRVSAYNGLFPRAERKPQTR